MLPDIGATELLVIAVVALIVVGPKDLPVLLRKLGQFMAKLRGMAAEFRASFDEMARQSELDDLRKEVEAMRRGQFADIAEQASGVEISQTFDDINQSLTDAGVQLHPPMSYQYNELSAPEAEAPKPRKRAPAKPQAAVATKATATPKKAKAAAPKAKAAPAKAAPPKAAPKPRRRPTVEPG
ncbi:MAG: Sec-independent protein translocase protein TatB [Phenylobacterium sp.]